MRQPTGMIARTASAERLRRARWLLIFLGIAGIGSIAILWMMPRESLKTKYDRSQIGMTPRQVAEFMILRPSKGDRDLPPMPPGVFAWVAESEGSIDHDSQRFSQTRYISEDDDGFVELYFNFELISNSDGRLVSKSYWDKNPGRTDNLFKRLFDAVRAVLP
jgi:hypothetical protein